VARGTTGSDVAGSKTEEGETMSDTWIPTMRLRFVRKMVTYGEIGSYMTVLQQCFIDAETSGEVWQDVPLVQEEQL
jgi:hypothetical protein